jgi:hypothetical protein
LKLEAELDPAAEQAYAAAAGELCLSGSALVQLIRPVLARGAAFRFRAKGSSMAPLIQDGDIVQIAPLERPLRFGEVAACLVGESQQLVVHRVVGRQGSRVYTLGDGTWGEPEGPISGEAVLGRVSAVERRGRRVRLGLGPERVLVAFLSRRGWLRPLVSLAAKSRQAWRAAPGSRPD